MSDTHTVEFIPSGRGQARCAPNPMYPEGIAIDISEGKPSCLVAIPYPAKECGIFVVKCRFCRLGVALTAAGRADDPISLTMRCNLTEGRPA